MLDRTDRIILHLLQTDGRMTNADLAEQVGLSPSATLRRVRGLEERGVIDRYVALINPAALDRSTTAYVEISLVSQQESVLDEFEAAIVTHPAIRSCHLMAGDADYLVKIAIGGVDDYEQLHRTHLATLPHVVKIKSSFALRTVCDRTAHQL